MHILIDRPPLGVNPGAKAYFLQHVLHDWSDAKAHAILSNTVAAMSPTSRLIVIDGLMPARNASHAQAVLDLSMFSYGGFSRTQAQWENLFAGAGLEMVSVRVLKGMPTMNISVLEARKVDC